GTGLIVPAGALRYVSRAASPTIRSPSISVLLVPSVTARKFTPTWFGCGCDPGPVVWNIPSAVAWAGGNAFVPPLPPEVLNPPAASRSPSRWDGQTNPGTAVFARGLGPE